MSDAEEGATVAVTSKGQATIPKEFREKLHIDTPGRVRFVENEEGEIVIRPVRRPSEMRGDLETPAAEDERPATELLREERKRDERALDGSHGTAGSDG
jgi:AbrB family looped-hinge helix DNA binding protein